MLDVLKKVEPTNQQATARSRARPVRFLRGWLGVVAREPLTHFLLAGLVIFLAGQAWRQAHDPKIIEVSPAQLREIADDFHRRQGVSPTPGELRAAVDAYVGEEALYREGLAQGIDRGDELVRRRIIQKMQFAQDDDGAPRTPADADLRAYYGKHRDRYAWPAEVSFQHLYFATGDGVSQAMARAATGLARLKAGARPVTVGDPSPDRTVFTNFSEADAERVFGRSPLPHALFEAPVGTWSGPVASGIGVHLIRVEQRSAPRVPPFEEVRNRVTSDYLREAREARARATVAEIVSHYRVVVPPPSAAE